MASDPPKVFISYSHDSPEHAQHVLELAERLRKDGVPAGELGPLNTLARKPVEPLRFGTLSNLPERNPFFTGREQLLEQVREALAGQGRVALSGLGGVGKTQTAVEYAHRHLEEYDHVFLTVAASRGSIVSGYLTISGVLALAEVLAQDQTLGVDAVNH